MWTKTLSTHFLVGLSLCEAILVCTRASRRVFVSCAWMVDARAGRVKRLNTARDHLSSPTSRRHGTALQDHRETNPVGCGWFLHGLAQHLRVTSLNAHLNGPFRCSTSSLSRHARRPPKKSTVSCAWIADARVMIKQAAKLKAGVLRGSFIVTRASDHHVPPQPSSSRRPSPGTAASTTKEKEEDFK